MQRAWALNGFISDSPFHYSFSHVSGDVESPVFLAPLAFLWGRWGRWGKHPVAGWRRRPCVLELLVDKDPT